MPFDEPYFPQTFDVGNQGGAHIHFDSTGEYFYTAAGQLAYQLLPAGATFFGGDSSIELIPSPAGGGKSSIHFTGVGISDAVISGGAIINNRQGQLSLNSPAAATGATLNLTGDDSSLPGSQPVAALNTTGGSSVSVTGWAGDNSKGGLFRARIRDTAAAFHDMTWDGATFALPNTAAESQTWQALPLSNGWVNFGGAHAPASIQQHGPVVRIKGLIKSGNTLNGTVIAAIPAAAMPAESLIWATTTNDAFCTIGIDTGLGGLICRAGVTATWLDINVTYSVR